MKFNKSPKPKTEDLFSNREGKEQISKLKDYSEDPKQEDFKKKIRERKEKKKKYLWFKY